MALWKIKTLKSGKVVELDINELKIRLNNLTQQDNVEIIQLALQSIVEELDELRYAAEELDEDE